MNGELIFKVQSRFGTEENHRNAIEFMLNSDIGNWILGQTKENINELAVLMEQYYQMKIK